MREATGADANGSAAAALEHAQAERDVYLVLDQAEEYFLYHADDGGPASFAETLPLVLGAPLRINVLVSLREDSLAKLDRFTGRIPGLFSNTLRLDRLDRASARAAIVRPAERYTDLTGVVGLRRAGARRGRARPGRSGADRACPRRARHRRGQRLRACVIEAPYLQLVMQRIWEEERAAASGVLRAETLRRLGGAQHIVEEHLAGAMAELSVEQKDIAARLFNHLVTPSGTKIAHDVSDLADFAGAPVSVVSPVLERLSELRILRSIEEGGHIRYEIFHDVLAEPVLAWRAEHEADRELEAQKREADRRHRRLLAVIGVGAIALAAMSAVTVYALTQRTEAREQARNAKANELEANAGALLASDPELSLLLATEAAEVEPGESAERALRDALLDVAGSRRRRRRRAGSRGSHARAPARRRSRAGGEVVVADPTTGEEVDRYATEAPATSASFADDGTVLVTGRDGRLRLVAPGRRRRCSPRRDGATASTISADGSRVAVVSEGRRSPRRHVDWQAAPLLSPSRRRVGRDLARQPTGADWRRRSSAARLVGTERAADTRAARATRPSHGDRVQSRRRARREREHGRDRRVSGERRTGAFRPFSPGGATGLLGIAFSADGEHVVDGREGWDRTRVPRGNRLTAVRPRRSRRLGDVGRLHR